MHSAAAASFALAPQAFPKGMDDDAGAITAWYASAKPSFYPLAPGEPSQVVATLAITNARIDLAECRAVSIRLTGPMAAGSITSNGTAVH